MLLGNQTFITVTVPSEPEDLTSKNITDSSSKASLEEKTSENGLWLITQENRALSWC